jgi:hypothetical protein
MSIDCEAKNREPADWRNRHMRFIAPTEQLDTEKYGPTLIERESKLFRTFWNCRLSTQHRNWKNLSSKICPISGWVV